MISTTTSKRSEGPREESSITDPTIYHQQDGYTYIRVEPTKVAREMENLELTIQLARGKIEEIKRTVSAILEESTEYEDRMDEVNDLEMLIDDSQVRSRSS
jgi:hypothetical protein